MSFPPQGPPPYGQPPYGQPPHGNQPPHWPAPQGQPWPGHAGAPPPYGRPPQWSPGPSIPAPRPPSKNSGLIIVGVVVVAIIALLGALAVVAKSVDGGDKRVVSDEQRAANAITAEWSSEFDVVCKDGSVRNAGPYTGPYKFAAFYQGLQDGSWYQVADQRSEDPSEINVVACLIRKSDTEVKSGQCESTAWDKPITIGHYAVQYEIELREAKTGKYIGNLGTVNGPAGDCPSVAFFDWVPDKLYGEPDGAAVEEKLAEFAG